MLISSSENTPNIQISNVRIVSHHRFKITQYWTNLWQYTILLLQSALPFGKAERIHLAPSWSHKWELYGIEIQVYSKKLAPQKTILCNSIALIFKCILKWDSHLKTHSLRKTQNK